MNIIIRKAKVPDFLAISELDRRAWQDNRNSGFIPDGEHVWRLWVRYSTVFVAKHNKKIVGVALLFKANDCSLYLFHKIFIDKNYRGKKIGNMFFENIVNFLDREKANCLLTTDPVNAKMIHLCAKYGFNEKQLVKGYYRPDEDRLVIRRRYSEISALLRFFNDEPAKKSSSASAKMRISNNKKSNKRKPRP